MFPGFDLSALGGGGGLSDSSSGDLDARQRSSTSIGGNAGIHRGSDNGLLIVAAVALVVIIFVAKQSRG